MLQALLDLFALPFTQISSRHFFCRCTTGRLLKIAKAFLETRKIDDLRGPEYRAVMIKAYKWTRRLAYLCGGAGLVSLYQGRLREPDLPGIWTRSAFGLIIVFFVLLLISYFLFVVIKIQRQQARYRRSTTRQDS